MHRSLLFLFFSLSIPLFLQAQKGCCDNNYKAGQIALKAGNYAEAERFFTQGSRCGDKCNYDFKSLIEQAKNLKNKKSGVVVSPTPSKPKPNTPSVSTTFLQPQMVFVQGGTFDMGDNFNDPEATSSIEKHVHSVTLSSYNMGKYEVTFEEYDAFCEATKRTKPKDEGWGRGKRPVINVSWDDATAYCKWLKDQTGKNFRLPTEAEWEFAARDRGKKIRFGNGKDIADPSEINFDSRADYKKSYSVAGVYRQKTVAVNSLSSNGLGLYHMSGNVWEWCQDWYDENFYKNSPINNPICSNKGTYRVLRGGPWSGYPQYCRSAARASNTPDYRDNFIGFRLVFVP